jgi:poly-gamma-glutamate system protein
MRVASEHLYRAKKTAGLAELPGVPPAERGLIGVELTPLVTTLGSLEAKRAAVSPAWAAELTRRLDRAGIGEGDTVAASFSGSFPGLNLAVVAACTSLGARVVAVSSVTASTWGATESGFTWPEMEARLVEAGLMAPTTVAVSPGGENDNASDLDPESRELARTISAKVATRLGADLLAPSDLDEAVRMRLEAFRRHAAGRPISLYVSSGGSHASLGAGGAVLRQRSGFLPPFAFAVDRGRGVMAEMAARGVPVLHLLNIRELALRWSVPAGAPAHPATSQEPCPPDHPAES